MAWYSIFRNSKCVANLNLTQLLAEGKISDSEFARLKLISMLGFKSIVMDIVVALILFWSSSYLLGVLFGEVPLISFFLTPVFIWLGLSCAKLDR